MKIPGKLYVDREKGYLEWCGLFKCTEKPPSSLYGLLGVNDVWLWSIIDGKYLVNYEHTDNYYKRREATTEEIGEISKLYETLKQKKYTTLYFLLDLSGKPIYVSLSKEEIAKKMEGTKYILKKKIIKINEI